jgi:hypothetical protein
LALLSVAMAFQRDALFLAHGTIFFCSLRNSLRLCA